VGQLEEEDTPPRGEGTPPTMDEDPTTDDGADSTGDEDDIVEGIAVQPVQAKAIERVRKMVPLGTPEEKRVVPRSSPLVPRGAPQSGPPSGAPKGGDPGGAPKKAEKQPKATPPAEQSNAPPKQFKVVPKPLVEMERKPTPKAKEPDMREVITPAQKELVDELLRMQQHDPDVVPMLGVGLM